MKKTIAIFCFTSLLLSTSSLSLFYWAQEQWHEQERFASIVAGEINTDEAYDVVDAESENLDNLKSHKIRLLIKDKTILPIGYQWEEKGREFSHEGMFYDIVSLTKTDAGWELIAASDKEEAEIVANQSKAQHVGKEFAANKKSNKQKFNFNISIFDQISVSQCQQAFLHLNQLAYTNYQDRLTEPSLGQIFPPPKAV